MQNFRPLLIALSLALSCTISEYAIANDTAQVEETIKKLERYTKGLKLGISFEQAQTYLGAPKQKKHATMDTNQKGLSYTAVWEQKGYMINAGFSADHSLKLYAVRWFGNESEIPAYKDILVGHFSEGNQHGKKTAILEGQKISIRWEKTPVPSQSKEISVLTVLERGLK